MAGSQPARTAPTSALALRLAGSSISTIKAPFINFTTYGTDFASIEPPQDQVFYIGDGRTSTGVMQAFVVPQAGNSLWCVRAQS